MALICSTVIQIVLVLNFLLLLANCLFVVIASFVLTTGPWATRTFRSLVIEVLMCSRIRMRFLNGFSIKVIEMIMLVILKMYSDYSKIFWLQCCR